LPTTAFLTDSTLCIGCKACEVACKEYNQVPADGYALTGRSYDNTLQLGHSTWRHVAFVEMDTAFGAGGNSGEQLSWSFVSDVCKHCAHAGCLGEIDEIRDRAARRVSELHERGMTDAVFWDSSDTSVGGTHAMFIVRGDPEAYNLPRRAEVPTIYLRDSWRSAAAAAAMAVAGTQLAFLAHQ
jgi:hypothetical protein